MSGKAIGHTASHFAVAPRVNGLIKNCDKAQALTADLLCYTQRLYSTDKAVCIRAHTHTTQVAFFLWQFSCYWFSPVLLVCLQA